MWVDFNVPVGWGELARRTAKDTSEDDVLGLAAQLAYYFFLALFPALLCLLALASLLPLDQVIPQVIESMSSVLPREVVPLIREQILQVTSSPQGGLFTIGFLGALWSSSAALVAVTGALNRAYDIEEGRPWWKVRLTAILLTVGVAFFALVALTLFVAGPEIGAAMAERFGMGAAFQTAWNILQWPVALALVVVAVGLIYYFAPDADQDWVFLTPGAVVAVVLWAIASLGFRYYITSFGNYTETYGAIAGVVILLLWFYISGIALLVGAELNAEIEHASPHAKAPGEKVPGEKKKIGARARRAYEEKIAGREGRVETLRQQYPAVPGYARRGVMLGGLILGLFRRKVGS
jgi:membrane protein